MVFFAVGAYSFVLLHALPTVVFLSTVPTDRLFLITLEGSVAKLLAAVALSGTLMYPNPASCHAKVDQLVFQFRKYTGRRFYDIVRCTTILRTELMFNAHALNLFLRKPELGVLQ